MLLVCESYVMCVIFPQSVLQVCLVSAVAIGVSVTTRRCATTSAELAPVRSAGLELSVKNVRETKAKFTPLNMYAC